VTLFWLSSGDGQTQIYFLEINRVIDFHDLGDSRVILRLDAKPILMCDE